MAFAALLCKKRARFPYLIFHIRIFSYRDMRDLHLSSRWKKKIKKKNFVAFISIARRKYASRSSYNAKTWYNCRQRENKTTPFAPFLSPPFHLGGWCRLRRIALYRDSKSSESTSRASKCNRFPSRSLLLFKRLQKTIKQKSDETTCEMTYVILTKLMSILEYRAYPWSNSKGKYSTIWFKILNNVEIKYTRIYKNSQMRETKINYVTNRKIAGLSHRLSQKSGLYVEQHIPEIRRREIMVILNVEKRQFCKAINN